MTLKFTCFPGFLKEETVDKLSGKILILDIIVYDHITGLDFLRDDDEFRRSISCG